MPLTTFQSVERVAQLRAEGRLVSDWARILGGVERSYRSMVEEMARHGIDCHGRPPVWAWSGPVTLGDALMLLDPEHELSRGYAAVTFAAPAGLVLLSDYGPWCDALFENARWVPPSEPDGSAPRQATLPYLDLAWVARVEALPTEGFDALDWSRPL